MAEQFQRKHAYVVKWLKDGNRTDAHAGDTPGGAITCLGTARRSF